MNKKIVITYSMLFLFAFTFALSLTLASSARAEGGLCCVISMCPPPSVEVQEMGHWMKVIEDNAFGEVKICVNPGGHPCDWTYNCGPVP